MWVTWRRSIRCVCCVTIVARDSFAAAYWACGQRPGKRSSFWTAIASVHIVGSNPSFTSSIKHALTLTCARYIHLLSHLRVTYSNGMQRDKGCEKWRQRVWKLGKGCEKWHSNMKNWAKGVRKYTQIFLSNSSTLYSFRHDF